MPSLRMRRAASPAAALATWHARRAVGVVGVDGHRRVLHRGRRPLERERHVGELVLDRLERADRHVELLALLRVRERHVEDATRGADHLGRERHVRAVAPRRERRRAASGCGSRRAASVSSCEQAAREVDGRDEAQRGTLGGVDDGDRRAGPDDRDAVDAVGFEHERLASGPSSARATVPRSRGAVVPPVSDAYERGREERSGRGRRSRSPRGTGRGRPRARRRARCTRAGAPQRFVRRRVVDVRAHERGRALAVEQLARGVAQQLLIVGEGEVHRCRLRPREAEHALGDDVALDLGAAARDRVRERHEEAVRPSGPAPRRELGSVTGAERPADLHAELERGLARFRRRHLHVASARAPTSPARTTRSPCSRARAGSPRARTPRRSCAGRSGRASRPVRRASSTSPSTVCSSRATPSTQRPGALVRERSLRDAPSRR